MTRSHTRSTTWQRAAIASVALLVPGLTALPAASLPASDADVTIAETSDLAATAAAAAVRAEAGRAEVRRSVDLLQRSEAARAEEAERLEQFNAALAAHEAHRLQAFTAALAAHDAARLQAYAAAVEARAAADRAAAVRAAERAEAARVAAERRAAAPRQAPSGGSMSGGWAALRNCESGGNYGAVSGTGTYRGAYQFSRSTWNSVAARSHPHLVGVDPAAASPGDQDAMARSLHAASGSSPWPHCGRHL